MTQSEAIAGVHSYLLWGAESTYNTAVAVTSHFSANVQSWKWNVKRNTTGHYGFSGSADSDGRKILKYTHGVLDISPALEIKATNFRFFKHILGAEAGSGPYTYTIGALPTSITVATDIDNPGSAATDQEATGSGGVFESVTIKSSLGQPVTLSADMRFAKVVLDTTLSSRVALPNEAVYNFDRSSIELPSGANVSNIIDSFELTIKNGYNMLAGLNSQLVLKALPKGVELSVKVTLKYLDNTLYTAALGATTPTATGGPTEYATMVLNLGNADGDTFEITLSRVPLSEFTQIHTLQDPIDEELTFTAGDISCVETLA